MTSEKNNGSCKSKYLSFITVTLVCFSITAQYRNMSIGAHVSTADFSNSYLSSAIDVQYNTRNTFSFRSGFSIDYAYKEVDTYFKFYNYDVEQYQSFVRTDRLKNRHFNVPLLAQATFGKRFYFTVTSGFLFSCLLKKPFVKTDVYWVHPNSGQLESTTEGYVSPPYKNECNVYIGAGFAVPVSEHLILTLEAAGLYRLDNNNSYYGYNAYNDFRLSLGVNYQFNIHKESDYTFTNYSIKIKKATNGI